MHYLKANGLSKTAIHALEVGKRNIFQNRFIIFYADIATIKDKEIKLPDSWTVECKQQQGDIKEIDLNRLLSSWNKTIKNRQIRERFDKGAILWFLKINNELAAFKWTIRKKPVKPYFFPLTDCDVHVFDAFVFPEFRGKNINAFLTKYVFFELKKDNTIRAFAEVHAWNKQELNSIQKSGFIRLSSARKFHFFGRNVTIWSIMPKGH